MPGAKGIKAGRAYVELGVDDRIARGLKRAQARLKAFGAGVGRIGAGVAATGAAMAAPLLGSVRHFASAGDRLAKMAKRTGFTVEALSELSFAAERSGTDVGSLENSLRRMQRTVYDAGRNLSTATDALGDLGLSVAEIDGMAPDRQFELLAERIAQVEDPTRRAAIAMTIFGRSGTQLIPLMADGAAGIRNLRNEAKRLGLTVSTDAAKAAEELTDRWTDMTTAAKRAVFELGATLAKSFGPAIGEIQEAISMAASWVDRNRELVRTIAKIAVALVAVGAAAKVLGTLISLSGSAVGAVGRVVGTVSSLAAALGGPATLALGAFAAAFVYVAAKIAAARAEMLRIEIATRSFGRLVRDLADAQRDLADAQKAAHLDGQISALQRILGLQERLRDVEEANIAHEEGDQGARRRAEEWDRRAQATKKQVEQLEALRKRRGPEAGAGAGLSDADLEHELAVLRARAIEDATEREIALIRLRYKKRMDAAREGGKDLAALEKLQGEELAQARKRGLRRAQEEQAEQRRQLGEKFDQQQQAVAEIEAQIARAQIEVSKTGVQRQRALLELEKKQMLAEARRMGIDPARVDKLFALRGAAMKPAEALRASTRGTFNAAALFGFGSTSTAERTAKAAEQTAKNTAENNRLLKDGAPKFAGG